MLAKSKVIFNAVGGGQVLAKYFLPILAKDRAFRLRTVLSRGNNRDFLNSVKKSQYFPRYKNLPLNEIVHIKTNGQSEDICRKLTKNCPPDEPILVLTPPQTHLELIKELLISTNRKIYVDKPAVTSLKDFQELVFLMQKFPGRVYLAEQYVYGRAPSFLKTFKRYRRKLGRIIRAEIYLEEGQHYFELSQRWTPSIKEGCKRYFDLTGSWFADVGPELDLGVHLLATLFLLSGSQSAYKIVSSGSPKDYLENYGVEAQLIIKPIYQPAFPVRFKCGKRCGQNNRYFKLICEKGEIWQRYTSKVCVDPVYIKTKGESKLICQNTSDFNYFYPQLEDLSAWLKSSHDQNHVLRALECALRIKHRRLAAARVRGSNNHFRMIAMIPARMDNRLLKRKHIREMAGKPMIYYAVKAAQEAGVFDRVYVNSESSLIGSIGQKLGASFYKRDPELAEEGVNNEEFVFDFLQNIKTEYLFMINPNKPLISPEEINAFVKTMLKKKYDVMFSTESINTQVFFQGKPVNFRLDRPHLRSTQIEPAQAIQWTITGWKAKTFLESYLKNGHAVYSGKLGLFPVSENANFSVKEERDFIIAEKIINLAAK